MMCSCAVGSRNHRHAPRTRSLRSWMPISPFIKPTRLFATLRPSTKPFLRRAPPPGPSNSASASLSAWRPGPVSLTSTRNCHGISAGMLIFTSIAGGSSPADSRPAACPPLTDTARRSAVVRICFTRAWSSRTVAGTAVVTVRWIGSAHLACTAEMQARAMLRSDSSPGTSFNSPLRTRARSLMSSMTCCMKPTSSSACVSDAAAHDGHRALRCTSATCFVVADSDLPTSLATNWSVAATSWCSSSICARFRLSAVIARRTRAESLTAASRWPMISLAFSSCLSSSWFWTKCCRTWRSSSHDAEVATMPLISA
mmetsp:Transcript_22214/g.77868  ORF Transcript_22214/g.77868 Transcript_22214/m.77868 type:complete len:313 (-) Transcript_22214:1157-2095(-)